MPVNPSTYKDKVQSFWHLYVEKLHESGVKPPFDRWTVRRAEQYIAAHPDRRLADQSPGDVESYLTELGRQEGLKDWQFRQAVDAIRMLFVLAGVGWLDQVDWEQWRASARALEPEHPTVARDYSPDTQEAQGASMARAEPSSFDEIRRSHGPLLARVTAAIRVRGFSIRTEQTYLHWIMRFIVFLGNADPAAKGAADVSAFLEYLAVERKVSASTQNLALNALVFLYREVLKREGLDLGDFARAKRPRRLPTVLTHAEVTALLGRLSGTQRLKAPGSSLAIKYSGVRRVKRPSC